MAMAALTRLTRTILGWELELVAEAEQLLRDFQALLESCKVVSSPLTLNIGFLLITKLYHK